MPDELEPGPERPPVRKRRLLPEWPPEIWIALASAASAVAEVFLTVFHR